MVNGRVRAMFAMGEGCYAVELDCEISKPGEIILLRAWMKHYLLLA